MNLAKSYFLRHRIARRVQKDTGIKFPARSYQAWLKANAKSGLRKPANQAGADLALSLNMSLEAKSSWASRDDRHSLALQLVQATYLAVVSLSPPGDAAVLHETWAQSRHDAILREVAQLATGRPYLTRQDHGTLLLAESAARRRRRLASLDITEAQVAEALSVLDSHLPVVPSGKLRILVGAFGSGKSELAEAWFRQRATDYINGVSATVPVWLHASDMDRRSLDELLRQYVGLDQPCAIVVDGLDEVDGSTAARIVSRVGVFVETNSRSSALLTSRPGVVPEDDEQIAWDGLSPEHARRLIETISGRNHATWEWNPTLVDSVRRPFFALGAGVLLAEGSRAPSQAGLIRRLVELALGRPSSSAASVQDSELYQILVRCAVNLVGSGGTTDGLSFQERQQIRKTRLIAGLEDKSVFTLPIFQQWFAAQALLDRNELLERAISTPQLFDRWRWSISIAGMSAPTADNFDQFFLLLMDANPGAAAWVLDQIASARGWPSRGENTFVDPSTAGKRFMLATRSWINVTSNLSPELFPIERADDPIALRVAVQDGTVTTVWNRSAPEHDSVTALEKTFNVNKDRDWRFVTSQGAVAGHEWPWVIQQKRGAEGMSKALVNMYRIGPSGGVWHTESRYALARLVANERSPLFTPIDRQLLIERITDLLKRAETPRETLYQFRGHRVSGTDLLDLFQWITSTNLTSIRRPLPAPDQDFQTGWVWSCYTDERLLSFIAEAYGLACVAYDEARETTFAGFDWAMGTASPHDFGVVAIVEQADHSAGWVGGPTLTMTIVPLSTVKTEAERFGTVSRLSENGRALVVDKSRCGLADSNAVHDYFLSLTDLTSQAGLPPFGRWSMVQQAVLFTSSPRASSEIACDWIWNDLKALKIADGAGPRFK